MFRLTLLLLVALIPAATSPGAMSRSQAATPRVVEVMAERFEFWPSEITLTQGEEIELRIQSADTIHGFHIVGTNTSLIVPKRGKGEAVAMFSATTPGRYTIECNRMCGAGHHFMRASLIVKPASTGGTR